MPDGAAPSIAVLPSLVAEGQDCGPFLVTVQSREEFLRWLEDPHPGCEGIQVEGLLGDPEVWRLAAQGDGGPPLDLVLDDPAAEYSMLYRLVEVRLVRPVRVTIPAKTGLLKALRLAVAIQLPVRILPGQPDTEALAELAEAAQFYLRDPLPLNLSMPRYGQPHFQRDPASHGRLQRRLHLLFRTQGTAPPPAGLGAPANP